MCVSVRVCVCVFVCVCDCDGVVLSESTLVRDVSVETSLTLLAVVMETDHV